MPVAVVSLDILVSDKQCYFGKLSKEPLHFVEQQNTSQATRRQTSALQDFFVFLNTTCFALN